MRMYYMLTLTAGLLLIVQQKLVAQSKEVEQLLLNVEKLDKLKKVLSQMKQGYNILSDGYKTVRNVSQGNFHLHQVFLEGLMQASPAVRKYRRIADIVQIQVRLVSQCSSAITRLRKRNLFSSDELRYLGEVHGNLLNKSLRNLEELLGLISAGQLQMNDAERLDAIDRIYGEMQDMMLFLKDFHTDADILSLRRVQEQRGLQRTEKLYGEHKQQE